MEISLQTIVLFSALTFAVSYFTFGTNKKIDNSNNDVI